MSKTGDFELVLGNRQILAMIVVAGIVLGILFGAGYIAGRHGETPGKQAPGKQAPAARELGEPARVPATMEFVRIAPGRFVMGYTWGEDAGLYKEIEERLEMDIRPDAISDAPPHRVRITKGFEMSKYEVSQGQWEAVMGAPPKHATRSDYPVEYVSWNDVQEFLRRINARNDGYLYRLPTEAEWEYAARAGTRGRKLNEMYREAWDFPPGWHGISIKRPVDVTDPNAWGLHGMLGNVAEWCQDWYGERYYRKSAKVDPQGPRRGSERVYRGGGANWVSFTTFVWTRASAGPEAGMDSVGFRCVREKAR